jgi:hypothetical protein
MAAAATFYTVSEAGFFPGTVALLNSLRLTGHRGPLVVLDAGLTSTQRKRLEEHATVVDIPVDMLNLPPTLKPFPFLVGASGPIVIIDSDMIVTASLAPALALADQGKICLFPDPPVDRGRWFAEWEEAFSLAATPRHQTYLNSGFVALSTERWPDLLERWWKACCVIPADRVFTDEDQLFRDGDQDALNAILMSEIEPDAVAVLPENGELYADDSGEAVIADESRLLCYNRGEAVSIVHQILRPKAWSPSGWRRILWSPDDVFVRLLPRVVLAEDVELRLDAGEVPWWLRREGRLGVAGLRALVRSKRRARALIRRLLRL